MCEIKMKDFWGEGGANHGTSPGGGGEQSHFFRGIASTIQRRKEGELIVKFRRGKGPTGEGGGEERNEEGRGEPCPPSDSSKRDQRSSPHDRGKRRNRGGGRDLS